MLPYNPSFRSSTAGEMSKRLMQLPAGQRLNAILQAPDASSVVKALTVQDFYFSVQELGPDDALSLLALARVDQINHLFDLQWWVKEAVQPSRALEWIERLAGASEEKLLSWLYEADFELLVTLFKKWITAAVINEDEDTLEVRDHLPVHTLDDTYYWEARYPQYEDFLKQLLGMLFEINQGFYRELMNHVLYASEVEMEEDAYRFHRGRLEDNAVPDFYDALEIYRPLTEEKIQPRLADSLLEPDVQTAPAFPLARASEADLLVQTLEGLQDAALINTIQMELAALANKVLVADQLPPDSAESLRWSVDKAGAMVTLGLDISSQGRLEVARTAVGDCMLEHFFRLGHTRLSVIPGRLRAVLTRGWLSRWPSGGNALESDWREIVDHLLEKTPQFLPRGVPGGVPPKPELFRRRKDLLDAAHIVDVVESLSVVHDALDIPWEELETALWSEGQVRRVEDVTLGNVVLTAAARWILDGTWRVLPLEVSTWYGAFGLLTLQSMDHAVRRWMDGAASAGSQRSLLEEYFSTILQDYSREMEKFSGEMPPDPELVRFFLFASTDAHG